MQRPTRANKGQSSQNFDEYDHELMKKAIDLRWVFTRKGDQKPTVIPYNHVMWPKTITTRQRVNLEKAPPKTKIKLWYENKLIDFSLSCVLHKSVIDHAMELVHNKMIDGDFQLSDVSYHDSQPSPSPARSALKRPLSPGKKKAKKSIKFCTQPEPSVSLDDDREAIFSSQKGFVDTCSLDDVSNKLFDVVEGKFRQLIAIHEDHVRKVSQENNRFRARFSELLKKQKGEETIQPARTQSSDPLMYGELDLMNLTPIGGPMSFGRLLAATLFGADENCELINQRLDVRISKNNCRTPADAKKEALFKECVSRFYQNNTEKALKSAIRGANQFGTDMKYKFTPANETENRDPNTSNE